MPWGKCPPGSTCGCARVRGSGVWHVCVARIGSGSDLKVRRNGCQVVNRVLYYIWQNTEAELISIDGGGLRNAIPRESNAVIALPSSFDLAHHISKLRD